MTAAMQPTTIAPDENPVGTNVLLRSAQPGNPHHGIAVASVASLILAGRSLCISSQVIYEFLAVATKPIPENGLGMSQSDADAQLATLLAGIDVLYDSESVAAELRRLVVAHGVSGKKVHDARLIASMTVFGIQEHLTFNVEDFKRFSQIAVMSPTAIAKGISPL